MTGRRSVKKRASKQHRAPRPALDSGRRSEWATKGLLPSVTTLGGHRRFRAADVDAFVRQHQRLDKRTEVVPSRVLIIDNDPQFARYLKSLIAAHAPGVTVHVARDGFSAGMKCGAIRPDIVTLDLQMPNMDGLEVCHLLRATMGRVKPRIVAVTAFASIKNIEDILAAGANACIKKTLAPKLLLRELGVSPTPTVDSLEARG
jgi:CheY-like chemotaxis protein